MNTFDITVGEFLSIAKQVVDENPDNVNPRSGGPGGACMYRNHEGHHCLIGEILINKLGIDYDPGWEGQDALIIMEDSFQLSVAKIAGNLQTYADEVYSDDDPSTLHYPTWGEVWRDFTLSDYGQAALLEGGW